MVDGLIVWCLTPILAVFQLYSGIFYGCCEVTFFVCIISMTFLTVQWNNKATCIFIIKIGLSKSMMWKFELFTYWVWKVWPLYDENEKYLCYCAMNICIWWNYINESRSIFVHFMIDWYLDLFQHLVDRVSMYVHAHTLYSSVRPFGVSVILGSYNQQEGPQMYLIDPSGVSWVI